MYDQEVKEDIKEEVNLLGEELPQNNQIDQFYLENKQEYKVPTTEAEFQLSQNQPSVDNITKLMSGQPQNLDLNPENVLFPNYEQQSNLFQTPIRRQEEQAYFDNTSSIKQKLDFGEVDAQERIPLTPTNLFNENLNTEDLKWKEIAPNAPEQPLPPQEVQWDLVMKLPCLDKLHQGIKIKRGDIERFNQYQKAQYIAVLGFPGTGKSAVANYLINKTMNTGYHIQDNQFKFKVVETEVDQTIANVIFDTPGLNYPLKSEKDISKLFSAHHFNNVALLKEANTAFLIDFVRTMAHTVVLTMERTTFFDQVLLALFAQMKGDREIVVVHNFTDVFTEEQLDNRINQEIINAFHARREVLQPFDIPVFIQETPQYEHKQQIIHLVMVNNNSPLANLNAHVFNYINTQLTTTNRFRDMAIGGPVGELISVLKDQVRNYISFESENVIPDFQYSIEKKKIEFILEEEELDIGDRLPINPKFPKFFSFAQSGYNMPIQTKQQIAHQNFVPEVHILREDDNGLRFLFEVPLLKYDSVDFKLFSVTEMNTGQYVVQLQADRYLEKIELEFPKSEFLLKGALQEKVSWTSQVDAGEALDTDASKHVTIYEHGVLYVFVPFQ